MKTTIAALSKQGESAVSPVLEALKEFHDEASSSFWLALSQKIIKEKNVNTLIKKADVSPSVIGIAHSKTHTFGSNFLKLENVLFLYEGQTYTAKDGTSIIEVLKHPNNIETALEKIIREADDQYTFLALKEDCLIAGRDPVGVMPLYFGENKNFVAIASNKKALWELGLEKVSSFPPGHLAFATKDGFKFKAVKTFAYSNPQPITMLNAAEKLQQLLEQSIQRRINSVREVAVAFSGGLDSSLIAHLASKYKVKVNLIHVSLENQSETEEAIRAAEELALPLSVHLFKESDVEAALPKVVNLIEEADPIKASIGVPFFWTAEQSAEAGFKVLLAGQGADELFGGYQRYVKQCCTEGAQNARKTMFSDVVNIHENNVERDEKICIFHDVELRLPFASFDLVEYALNLPLELKFESREDSIRKLVLREVARNVGLPTSIADKPKKAIQYSTGISSAVNKIAKKQGKSAKEYVKELFLRSC